jgi:hypothetical protein
MGVIRSSETSVSDFTVLYPSKGNIKTKNSVHLVSELPSLAGEVSANFCG